MLIIQAVIDLLCDVVYVPGRLLLVRADLPIGDALRMLADLVGDDDGTASDWVTGVLSAFEHPRSA